MLEKAMAKIDAADPAEQFHGKIFVSLETYTKKGEPKRTPVSTIFKDGNLYLRSGPKKWKVRRIRNNPRVRVAPCSQTGIVKGAWMDGEARILDGDEALEMKAFFARQYGKLPNAFRLAFYRLFRGQPMNTYISIRLRTDMSPSAQKS